MGEDDDDVNDGIDKIHLVSDIIGEDGVPNQIPIWILHPNNSPIITPNPITMKTL